MPSSARPAQLSGWRLTLLACGLSFSTYFCMYAFRKPFAAASFVGDPILGLSPKTLYVISQIAGYALAKYLGVGLISQLSRRWRFATIVGLVSGAELALLVFALVPPPYKALALFANGLSLGMIWSLVVRYLEGRRSSDVLLAALSCSFIVASGVVKDIGRQLMQWGVSESWMPATTGLAFFPALLLSARLLDNVPDPDPQDEAKRQRRSPMTRGQRIAFARSHWPGLTLLLLVYLALTAFRDYRDNYGVELFAELGYGNSPGLFTGTELLVALGVLGLMAALVRFQSRTTGLLAVFAVILVGLGCIGVSTLGLQLQWWSGQFWMVGVGLGAYLAYVPFSSFLFDRIMAATRSLGTAVFAVNLADAVGYTGSMAMQLYKDVGTPEATHLEFVLNFSYWLSATGSGLVAMAAVYFFRKAQACDAEPNKLTAIA